MQYPVASMIPSLFSLDPHWLVELGPNPSDRFSGSAPNEETALEIAIAAKDKREGDVK